MYKALGHKLLAWLKGVFVQGCFLNVDVLRREASEGSTLSPVKICGRMCHVSHTRISHGDS